MSRPFLHGGPQKKWTIKGASADVDALKARLKAEGLTTATWLRGMVSPLHALAELLPTDEAADVRAGRALEAHYAAQPKRKIGTDEPLALQLVTGPQGACLLFEGLVVAQTYRQPDADAVDTTEIAAYLRDLAANLGAMTAGDFCRKIDGWAAFCRIGGHTWRACVFDDPNCYAWALGIMEMRHHNPRRPVATRADAQREALAMAARVAGEARAILRGLEGDGGAAC